MPADITKFTSHDSDGELMKRLTHYAQLKKDLEKAIGAGGGVPTEAQQKKIDELNDEVKKAGEEDSNLNNKKKGRKTNKRENKEED